MYFKCKITVTTAKKMDKDWNNYKEIVEKSINDFNKLSSVARTYKNIIDWEINNDLLVLTIESVECINSLRPLHLFSQILLEYDEFKDLSVNKRFLKIVGPIKILEGNTNKIEIKSDLDCLRYITNIFLYDGLINPCDKNLIKDYKNTIINLTNEFLNEINIKY